MNVITHPRSPVRSLLVGSVLLVAAIAVFVYVAVAGQRLHDLRIKQCNEVHAVTARMPSHVLPLAIVAVLLAAFAAALIMTSVKPAMSTNRATLTRTAVLLAIVAVLVTLLVVWLGVYATIADAAPPIDACT